jgi:hypothetical protein
MHKTIREQSIGTWESSDGKIKLKIEKDSSNESARRKINLEIDGEALIVDGLLDSYWMEDNYRLGNHMPYYIKDANEKTLMLGIDNSDVFELARA